MLWTRKILLYHGILSLKKKKKKKRKKKKKKKREVTTGPIGSYIVFVKMTYLH